MTEDIKIVDTKIEDASQRIKALMSEIHKKIVWQDELIHTLIIWLLWKGHILIEGLPGVAKTMTVETLSKTLGLGFNRIQFTPDLLPSDLTGTEIYNPNTAQFLIKKGPIFNNFILADEINRAPSKVQSALLEAMAERHITIWQDRFMLDEPFMVLATQNPIEQSGTYKLPEAQLDRFMMKINVSYNKKQDEFEMYKKINNYFSCIDINTIFNKQEILDLQNITQEVYVSDNIFTYVTNIIDATRNPQDYNISEIKKYLSYWISPRGGISLIQAAKVHALMQGRGFVLPEDIKQMVPYVLYHRCILTYEAIVDNVDVSDIMKKILENIIVT